MRAPSTKSRVDAHVSMVWEALSGTVDNGLASLRTMTGFSRGITSPE
jgi:hypothetical protein